MRVLNVLKDIWPFLALAAGLFLLCFLWLRFLAKTRDRARVELAALYENDLPLYIERLENNRLLRLVYRRSNLLMMLLDGYLAAGDDTNAERTIALLDGMRLQPAEQVEFYQKRLSYYAAVPDADEARATLCALEAYLTRVKAADAPRYRELLDEARLLVRIYIDRDVQCIGLLQQKAAKTKNPVMRGVTQYRIAKLAYFKGDEETCQKYLNRAAGNVVGTYYEPIVREALKDRSILERK